VELGVPEGVRISVDGKELGAQHRLVFTGFSKGEWSQHKLQASFPDGDRVERTLLLRGGWVVHLPLNARRPDRPDLAVQLGRATNSYVEAFAVSPDRRNFVVGLWGGVIVMHELATGREVRTFQVALDRYTPIDRLSISSDCRRLLIGCITTSVLCDLPSGREVRRFPYEMLSGFTPNGKQFLARVYGMPSLVDVETGKVIQSFPTSLVRATALSPDGKQLITFSLNGRGAVWNADTGKQLRTIESLGHSVRNVEFSPDGRSLLIVANSPRGKNADVVMIRDLPGGKVRLVLENTKLFLKLARFSPDGRRILTHSHDDLFVWDAETGKKIYTIKEAAGLTVDRVDFGPAGTLLCLTWRGGIAVLDGGTGRPLQRFVAKATDHTRAATFMPDGSRVFLTQRVNALTADGTRTVIGDLARSIALADQPAFKSGDNRAWKEWWSEQTRTDYIPGEIGRTWDLQTGRFSASLSDPRSPRRSWSRGKAPRIVPIEQNDAAVFDLVHARTLGFLKGHGKVYQQPKRTIRNTGFIVVPGSSTVKTIECAPVEIGGGLDLELIGASRVGAVAISADGSQLLTGGKDRTAILWDSATAKPLFRLEGHGNHVRAVAFSPDGHVVLTASEGQVFLWDTRSGKKQRALNAHTNYVISAVFGSDGRTILTGWLDKTAILWDATNGRQLHRLVGHAASVAAVAFSPDGKQLLTGSDDMTAILWDAATGRRLRTFAGHSAAVTSVAFRRDGRMILTAAHDGTARLWDLASGDEIARLISRKNSDDEPGEDGSVAEWAVVTPEGLFDGSVAGRENVFYRTPDARGVVPLDRFFQDFYYPGLLAEIWRGERPMPGKPLQINPAPLVKMLLNDQAGTDRKAQVTIDVAVTDQGGGIKGPWLQHNRATLRSGTRVKTEGKTVHYRFPVLLVPGDNRLEARAATGDGARESDSASLTIPFTGKLPEPKLYVIAVGINRFAPDASIRALDFCVADARAIADLFKKRAGKLYAKVHVTPLYDEQATKANILKAVGDLSAKARPQDTLVLYVASHGYTVGQRFYLFPHDFKLAKGEKRDETPAKRTDAVALRGYRGVTDEREAAVRQHGLAIDQLGEALAAVPALKRVLIFDTCHSGSAIALAGKRQNPFAFRGAMERFSRAQGVYSLAATAADELAAENKELGHSILTYALLAGLQAVEGGPLKGQPLKAGGEGVDVLAWFRYARQQVPALYQRYVGRPQQVELSGEDQPGFPLLTLPPK
jgi:WD40 repeat protein/uncharacterized caspase-like protein